MSIPDKILSKEFIDQEEGEEEDRYSSLRELQVKVKTYHTIVNNIERTLNLVDSLRDYIQTYTSEEYIICGDLNLNDIHYYIESCGRIQTALSGLAPLNLPFCQEITTNLNHLLNVAFQTLQINFIERSEILTHSSTPSEDTIHLLNELCAALCHHFANIDMQIPIEYPGKYVSIRQTFLQSKLDPYLKNVRHFEEEKHYIIGSHPVLLYLSELHSLLEHEWILAKKIFPSNEESLLLDVMKSICKMMMDPCFEIAQVSFILPMSSCKGILKEGQAALIYMVLDVARYILVDKKIDWKNALEEHHPPHKHVQSMIAIGENLYRTAIKAFTNILDELKLNTSIKEEILSDDMVSPFVRPFMDFLGRLSIFQTFITDQQQNDKFLNEYLLDTLVLLLNNVASKVPIYGRSGSRKISSVVNVSALPPYCAEDVAQIPGHVFILNTYYSLITEIDKVEFLQTVFRVQIIELTSLIKIRKRQLIDCYCHISNVLNESTSNPKMTLKDRIKSFSLAVDVALKMSDGIVLLDNTARTDILQGIKFGLVQPYRDFYQTNQDLIEAAVSLKKYIKYDPTTFSTLLEYLFLPK